MLRPEALAYRPKDAAAVLGVSRATIFDMIAKGKITARKIGAATVISREELNRVLQAAPLADATKRAQASVALLCRQDA